MRKTLLFVAAWFCAAVLFAAPTSSTLTTGNTVELAAGDEVVIYLQHTDTSGTRMITPVVYPITADLHGSKMVLRNLDSADTARVSYKRTELSTGTRYTFFGAYDRSMLPAPMRADSISYEIEELSASDGTAIMSQVVLTVSTTVVRWPTIQLGVTQTLSAAAAILEFVPPAALATSVAITMYYVYTGASKYADQVNGRDVYRGIGNLAKHAINGMYRFVSAGTLAALGYLTAERLREMGDEELAALDLSELYDDFATLATQEGYEPDPEPEGHNRLRRLLLKLLTYGLSGQAITQLVEEIVPAAREELRPIVREIARRIHGRFVPQAVFEAYLQANLRLPLSNEGINAAFGQFALTDSEAYERFLSMRLSHAQAVVLGDKMSRIHTAIGVTHRSDTTEMQLFWRNTLEAFQAAVQDLQEHDLELSKIQTAYNDLYQAYTQDKYLGRLLQKRRRLSAERCHDEAGAILDTVLVVAAHLALSEQEVRDAFVAHWGLAREYKALFETTWGMYRDTKRDPVIVDAVINLWVTGRLTPLSVSATAPVYPAGNYFLKDLGESANRTSAKREFEMMQRVREAQSADSRVLFPDPVAVVQRAGHYFLVTRYIDGVSQLDLGMVNGMTPEQLQRIEAGLIELKQILVAAQVRLWDLSWWNFALLSDGRLAFFDFGHAEKVSSGGLMSELLQLQLLQQDIDSLLAGKPVALNAPIDCLEVMQSWASDQWDVILAGELSDAPTWRGLTVRATPPTSGAYFLVPWELISPAYAVDMPAKKGLYVY